MPSTDLVADLAKKSGLLWVAYAGRSRPVWHEWVDGAVCVVSGGAEQPLPGIAEQAEVTVLLRSRTTRALVAEARAAVEVVVEGSAHWSPVTAALRAGRLNLADPDDAVSRWSRESVVVRLVPTGQVVLAERISTDIGHTAPRLVR